MDELWILYLDPRPQGFIGLGKWRGFPVRVESEVGPAAKRMNGSASDLANDP